MISEEKLTQKLSIRGFVSWPLKKKGRKSLRLGLPPASQAGAKNTIPPRMYVVRHSPFSLNLAESPLQLCTLGSLGWVLRGSIFLDPTAAQTHAIPFPPPPPPPHFYRIWTIAQRRNMCTYVPSVLEQRKKNETNWKSHWLLKRNPPKYYTGRFQESQKFFDRSQRLRGDLAAEACTYTSLYSLVRKKSPSTFLSEHRFLERLSSTVRLIEGKGKRRLGDLNSFFSEMVTEKKDCR